MRETPTAGRWRVLANVTLVNLIGGGAAWYYILALETDLRADLGLDVADWGVLWSGTALGILLCSIPAGAAGDRFGVRRVVTVGLAVCGGALVLRSMADGFYSMLAVMILFGAGLSFLGTNLPKMLGIWFPPERLGLANGVNLAGFGAGAGSAMLVAPLVAGRIGGWRGATLIFGLLVLALAVYWTLAVREAPGGDAPGRTRMLAAVGRVLRVRAVWIVALSYMFFFGGYFGAIGYLTDYLPTERGLTVEATGAVLSVAAWAYVPGSFLLLALSDRIGRRKVVYVSGILVSAAAMFSLAFLLGLPLVLASIVWGFSAGSVGLLFVVPVEIERVGKELAGSAIGLATSAGFLGAAISSVVGMRLAGVRPLYGFVFFLVSYLLSVLLFATSRETGPAARRATDS